MSDYDLTYLSLGAGVQSSALLVCSASGLHNVPRADVAIFADTGDEPKWVYDYLKILEKWSPIPITTVSAGVLSEQLEKRSLVPFFTGVAGEEGMLRRKCTSEYKIAPIEKEVRRLLGYKPRQRVKKRALALIGISIDEALRMKPSEVPWITKVHPLINAEISRQRCVEIVTDAGLPKPLRSACVYCPFHSNHYWRSLKANHKEEWRRATSFDRRIRDLSAAGVREPAYLHRSCVPLDEADLNDHDPDQINMFTNECEGMCGV